MPRCAREPCARLVQSRLFKRRLSSRSQICRPLLWWWLQCIKEKCLCAAMLHQLWACAL